MSALMQGTTPSIEITISTEDFLLSNVTAMELYILNGRNLNTYEMSDLAIDTTNNTITKTFTEEETASLDPKSKVVIQARFWFADGSIVGINKISFQVADMLGVGS